MCIEFLFIYIPIPADHPDHFQITKFFIEFSLFNNALMLNDCNEDALTQTIVLLYADNVQTIRSAGYSVRLLFAFQKGHFAVSCLVEAPYQINEQRQ